MFLSKRSDLPLDKDGLSRFLPWLIAFMTFLACLSTTGVMALNDFVSRWDQNLSSKVTIQVPAADDAATTQGDLDAVLRALQDEVQIFHARPLDEASSYRLLEPWLGSPELLAELPIPRLIDVTLVPGAKLDVDALSARLNKLVANVTVDDHGIWLKSFINLMRTVQTLAIGLLGLIGLATIGTVSFATRSSLTSHQEVIEVLHLIGAHDHFIARQFADRAFRLGLRGGLIGLVMAIPLLLGLAHMSKIMEDAVIPDLPLDLVSYISIALIPIAVSLIAQITAHRTVTKTLRRML